MSEQNGDWVNNFWRFSENFSLSDNITKRKKSTWSSYMSLYTLEIRCLKTFGFGSWSGFCQQQTFLRYLIMYTYIVHSSEIEAFWPIKCPRNLRLLKLSHFLCWIWICIKFWNNCYVLQMRLDFQFIGVSRRDWRLKLFDSCNSRTFIGYPRGCPRLPGHPNSTYMGLYNVNEDSYN